MISLQQFYNETVNQSLLYPPNPESLRGQCYALASFYIDRVWGTPQIWKATAAEIMNADRNHYNVTVNNPNDPNQLPPVGALIVWSASLPGSGGAGHVAILWSIPAPHVFVSYDSNWGSKTAHLVTHNWSNVAGWVTPKSTVSLASATINTNQGAQDEMITTESQAHQVYKAVRPNGDANQDEINMTVNRRSFAQFFNDAQNEIIQRDQNLRDQAQHLAEQQALINQQNATIAELTSSGASTKQEYDEAVAKIADLNAQLATKHDVLTDLQNKITAATKSDEPAEPETPYGGAEQVSDTEPVKAPTWTVRFFSWALGLRKKH